MHSTISSLVFLIRLIRLDPFQDLLVEVFRDGVLLKDWTLQEVRQRADIPNGPFSQG